jgi:hypothetical protein
MTTQPSAAQSGGHKVTDEERNHLLDESIEAHNKPMSNFKYTFWPKTTVDRSTFSAVMQWGKELTSPLMISCMGFLSLITGGLILPIWLVWTLRPNKGKQTIFIDESGTEHWSLAPIPLAQRVLSGAVLIALLVACHYWWAAFHPAPYPTVPYQTGH